MKDGTDHTDKAGNSKLLRTCRLPLTGKGCVNRVITNFGVFDVTESGFEIVEIAPGVTHDELVAGTEARLIDA